VVNVAWTESKKHGCFRCDKRLRELRGAKDLIGDVVRELEAVKLATDLDAVKARLGLVAKELASRGYGGEASRKERDDKEEEEEEEEEGVTEQEMLDTVVKVLCGEYEREGKKERELEEDGGEERRAEMSENEEDVDIEKVKRLCSVFQEFEKWKKARREDDRMFEEYKEWQRARHGDNERQT
jgi:hypothetical protein